MATPYVINTMTLTARSTARRIDLHRVFRENAERVGAAGGGDAGPQEAPAVVFMVHRGRGGSVETVGGVRKKNGRAKTYSTNVFDNQASFVVRMPDSSHCNVKLFCNGHIQMTGARSTSVGREAADTVLGLAAGHCAVECDPPAECGASGPLRPSVVGGMNVCLINSHFRLLGGMLNRQAFYETASDTYGVQCSFQPCIYSAVKCMFMWRPETGDGSDVCLPYPRQGRPGPDRGTGPDPRPTARDCDGVCPLQKAGGRSPGCDGKGCCKKVTLLVFHTGSCIVTGAVSCAQISACHEWLSRVCRESGHRFFLGGCQPPGEQGAGSPGALL